MKVLHGIILVYFLSVLGAGAEQKYHIFTDAQGRSIEAKVVRYDEAKKTVTVQPKGRSAMTVPVNVFSAEDQSYIAEWSHNQTFLDERKLCLDFKRIKKVNDDKKRNSGYVSNMEYKYYNHSFEIEIENKSTVNLNDIELEYVVFYKQEHHINGNQDKVLKEGTLYSKKTISLTKKSKTTLSTDVVSLKRYRESGYSNVWPDLDGEVEGVMVKLSLKTESGETLTRQISYPERLGKAWTTNTKDAQSR